MEGENGGRDGGRGAGRCSSMTSSGLPLCPTDPLPTVSGLERCLQGGRGSEGPKSIYYVEPKEVAAPLPLFCSLTVFVHFFPVIFFVF